MFFDRCHRLNGGVGWTDEGSRWTSDDGRFSASDVGFLVTMSLRTPGKGQQGRTGQPVMLAQMVTPVLILCFFLIALLCLITNLT
jgi:hypothetical protein